jgi:hypothetical protein
MFASANLAQSATAESKHKEACATIAEKNKSHMVRLDHVLLFFSVQLIVVSVAGAVEKNEASPAPTVMRQRLKNDQLRIHTRP